MGECHTIVENTIVVKVDSRLGKGSITVQLVDS